MAAQDARGDRVEGAEPQPFGGAPADHPLEPLLHLARRLVGEGDGEDLAGEGAAQHEDMGEPRGQDAGLAGPRPGEHQHRPVDRLDGAALDLVEAGEMGVGRRRRRGDGGHGRRRVLRRRGEEIGVGGHALRI
jgi:hypothetical protein